MKNLILEIFNIFKRKKFPKYWVVEICDNLSFKKINEYLNDFKDVVYYTWLEGNKYYGYCDLKKKGYGSIRKSIFKKKPINISFYEFVKFIKI